MDIKITSVSKKSQNLSNSAAAVFVITNDDLKRSGVTTIPDALRMVPGVNVARIDSNKWAVSCRGFNGRPLNCWCSLTVEAFILPHFPVFTGKITM